MIVKRIWSVTKGEEENLLIFERKELRRMYDPISENGEKGPG